VSPKQWCIVPSINEITNFHYKREEYNVKVGNEERKETDEDATEKNEIKVSISSPHELLFIKSSSRVKFFCIGIRKRILVKQIIPGIDRNTGKVLFIHFISLVIISCEMINEYASLLYNLIDFHP